MRICFIIANRTVACQRVGEGTIPEDSGKLSLFLFLLQVVKGMDPFGLLTLPSAGLS